MSEQSRAAPDHLKPPPGRGGEWAGVGLAFGLVVVLIVLMIFLLGGW
jgi:hypothetical protein